MAQSPKQYAKQQLKDVLSIQSIGGIVQNNKVTDLQLSSVLNNNIEDVSYLYENQKIQISKKYPQYHKIKLFQTDEDLNLYKTMERSQREYFQETQELEKSIRKELSLSAFASEKKLVNILQTRPQKKAILQQSFNKKCICQSYLRKTYSALTSPAQPLVNTMRPLSRVTGKCYTQRPSPIGGKNEKLRNSIQGQSASYE